MRPVLICGGIGSKMWPSSRQALPKHFLALVNGKSLFRINYETLREKFKPSQIYIQTTPQQVEIAKKQAPEIPDINYFVEPEMRNQGPATGFMAAKLFKIAPDEPFILVQVDVLRKPRKKFLEVIGQMEKLVKSDKKLITGGIRPEYAIMGVDYLLASKQVANTGKIKVYQMEKWLGRDVKKEVEKHLKHEAVLAHANHYSWTPRLMLEAYRRHAPDWHQALMKMLISFGKANEKKIVAQEYARMEKGPAEKVTQHELNKGYVVELPFIWLDFGSWESVDRHLKSKGNCRSRDILEIDSQDCFVKKEKDKFVATIGVSNLVIVDTPDALLICKKDQSGRVGEVVEYLREKKQNELL